MSLSVPIHTSFMSTFFATCRDFEKKPQTLLREIIAYLPRENEFEGSVKRPSIGFREETRTLAEFKGDGPAAHIQGQVIAACPCWSWTDRFQEKIRALPPFSLRTGGLRWFTVRKFAEFYLENSNLTTPLRIPLNRLNVSLDEIIAEADLVLNREIESLQREFLHRDPRTQEQGGGFVAQFNEEEEQSERGEGPSLDQGSAMTEHAQPEEQSEEEEQPEEQDIRQQEGRPVQDLPRREHVVHMENDANALMNELLQDRMEGEAPYYITPQPSAKDTLKEIQSIIDEDVKDLIPEGTYLLLANKMKEAFNRS
jgi:hypothetical protein